MLNDSVRIFLCKKTFLATSVFLKQMATNVEIIGLGSWRIIFAVTGGLNITLSCCLALLEESPRFMLYSKKSLMALLILKQFYTINKSVYSETYKVLQK